MDVVVTLSTVSSPAILDNQVLMHQFIAHKSRCVLKRADSFGTKTTSALVRVGGRNGHGIHSYFRQEHGGRCGMIIQL